MPPFYPRLRSRHATPLSTAAISPPLLRPRAAALFLLLGLSTSVFVVCVLVVLTPLLRTGNNDVLLRARNPARGEGTGRIELWRKDAGGSTTAHVWVEPWPKVPGIPPKEPTAGEFAFQHKPSAWIQSRLLPWETGAAPWPAEGFRDIRALEMRGLPMRCVWCEFDYSSSAPILFTPGVPPLLRPPTIRGGVRVLESFDRRPPARAALAPVALPLRPYWPGLIVNTLFWALVWWCLFIVPPRLIRLLRSRARRRQNLCPHCRYDLRATPPSSPCPECGHAR